MYIVNFIFKNSAAQVGFCFKAFKAADELLKRSATGGTMNVKDDYECQAWVNMENVAAVVLNDIDKEMKRNAEQRVMQDKELQKAARGLNAASPIISPAANA